ncbi:NAD(+)--dinitrogen-reductase ADP-D-ribosyltransferase [Puniceicoccus vermicola]|uniref:NAD(+)--dinitrogen-reductase ADP-D-ribosyltransferase n=1 Tax=Puniceicoccus vermicola TaxID=388746 RepID=A0A7X1AYL9_9BACT|nr:NAD(+)--dinitrogen-reductase ADP-D-ribosyltransferase [Puniceicoccus vermicola]MBC2602169.1 NAD(+)--dinitrogen-reductase ADP-D-ribosyltransferase [Puniceicoccus vermicola]
MADTLSKISEVSPLPRKSGPIRVNHCNVPPWALASLNFNEHPVPVELDGVRSSNRNLFTRLDTIDDPEERGKVFHGYLSVKFRLHDWEQYESNARRSLRNSYLRFIRGWGVDSNSVEGAVLKGWVESRFGIPPTYHRGRLTEEHTDDEPRYAIDRMKGHARTNAIDSQLDLLFEFCQYELTRRHLGETHLTLYRGTCDPDEYNIIEPSRKRVLTARLNNLSSFTSDRERAWEFGSTVWEAQVPLSKIFFHGEILSGSILQGESEFLVVGGDYRLRELLY